MYGVNYMFITESEIHNYFSLSTENKENVNRIRKRKMATRLTMRVKTVSKIGS